MAASLIETASAVLSTAGTTITVTTSGAPAAGEKLIAVVYHTDDYTDTPAGWTQDAEHASIGVCTIFSKTATGSEGTSFVFTAPSSGSMTARVLRYSGLGAVHVAFPPLSSYSAGVLSSGSPTTAVADTFLIAGGGLRSAILPVTDMTPSGGFTAVASDLRATNTGAKSFLHVATRTAATAGTYQFVGTVTPETTTVGEATGVAYLQVEPNGSVTAVKATGTGLAVPPAVTTAASGTVLAVKATGTGTAVQPSADVITTITGGGAATGNGVAYPPTVTANNPGQVLAVKATGTGAAIPPGVGAPIAVITATGSGAAAVPLVIAGARVVAVKATGAGQPRVPAATGSAAISVTVTATAATGNGTARTPGVAMVETLPTNIGTGRVTARFGEAKVLVGDVDGIANLYPYTSETITFTSTAAVLLDATASPAAVVILPKPIVCTLDSQGYLVDAAGHRWCDLIATDDTDLTPAGRRWTVTFSPGLGISSFPMNVPAGSTIDLTSVIPT